MPGLPRLPPPAAAAAAGRKGACPACHACTPGDIHAGSHAACQPSNHLYGWMVQVLREVYSRGWVVRAAKLGAPPPWADLTKFCEGTGGLPPRSQAAHKSFVGRESERGGRLERPFGLLPTWLPVYVTSRGPSNGSSDSPAAIPTLPPPHPGPACRHTQPHTSCNHDLVQPALREHRGQPGDGARHHQVGAPRLWGCSGPAGKGGGRCLPPGARRRKGHSLTSPHPLKGRSEQGAPRPSPPLQAP